MIDRKASVVCNSAFRTSGNLLHAKRFRISDYSIAACMCVRAWDRLIWEILVHGNSPIYAGKATYMAYTAKPASVM